MAKKKKEEISHEQLAELIRQFKGQGRIIRKMANTVAVQQRAFAFERRMYESIGGGML